MNSLTNFWNRDTRRYNGFRTASELQPQGDPMYVQAATGLSIRYRQWQVGLAMAAAVVWCVVGAGAFAQDGSTTGSDTPVVRMMLKVQIPVEAGNRAIENGTMGKIFEDLMAKIKPEAAYFSQEDGLRTAYFVYVIDGTFEFAEIHEPLIQGLGARVFDQPALNWNDIGKAFEQSRKQQ